MKTAGKSSCEAKVKIHLAKVGEKNVCGVAKIGHTPYVKGGMASNYVWIKSKVTCKRCATLSKT